MARASGPWIRHFLPLDQPRALTTLILRFAALGRVAAINRAR
jgi:hypothetical protein